MATRVVTVNDILDGHVALDLECFDRIYLNGWVHNLQVSGQVVNFLTHHLGFPIPSPAILEKIGLRFRKAVAEFAAANDIEVVRFAKGERKLEVMRPHLDRLVREGRCGVNAVKLGADREDVDLGRVGVKLDFVGCPFDAVAVRPVSFDDPGTCPVPPWAEAFLGDLVDGFGECVAESVRGKSPPGWEPGGGSRGSFA